MLLAGPLSSPAAPAAELSPSARAGRIEGPEAVAYSRRMKRRKASGKGPRPGAGNRKPAKEPLDIPPACCTLDVKGREQGRLVAMFKALGNPTRLEIMKFLLTHPGCITGDIVKHLPIAQATVSQHLKVLRDAGWIEGTLRGPATCYCIREERVAWFREMVAAIF